MAFQTVCEEGMNFGLLGIRIIYSTSDERAGKGQIHSNCVGYFPRSSIFISASIFLLTYIYLYL
jgi:hypothetical protein